ncbi:MAG: sensor histidine kinase [Janthinobacterium lividum]
MRFTPRTILGQFITGSVLVQLVVFGIFLAVGVRRDFRRNEVRDLQRLARQTCTIVDVLDEPLTTGNADMLDHILRAVPISVTIAGVRITDPTGRTLRGTGQGLSRELNESERQSLAGIIQRPGYHLLQTPNGHYEGAQAVVSDGVIQAIVWVAPDANVTRRFPIVDLENLSIYAACALLGNLVLVWLLSGTLARPLRQLRRATVQVRNDPNDLSAFPLPAAVHNEAGELQASFNAMVTEIALHRRGVQDTLSLLDSMLEGAPIGFAFFDRDFRYVRLNRNLATMHGLPVEAHIGKSYRELLAPGVPQDMADTLEQLLVTVFESGMPTADIEISGATPDGQAIRTWQKSLFPVSVGSTDVRWVGAIVTDITERKRAEEAMRHSEQLASAGRLAASIVYQINNPLESITNLLYLLRTETALNDKAQEYVQIAESQLSRVGDITRQTLKFYRQPMAPTDVRLSEVLRSVLALHQARMQSPLMEVKLSLNDATVSFGYPAQLRQLFADLIGHAIDAMPDGGTLYIRARAARCMGKQGMRVTVADTGLGMPDAVQQRLFEPFFTTKGKTGRGLSLWVASKTLTQHRATLLVRSRVAREQGEASGTVFSVFFPYDGVPRGPIRVTSAAPAVAAKVV